MARSPIRIAHIVQTMGIGGMEGRIGRLARGLDPDRYEIRIITLRPSAARTVPLPPEAGPTLVPVPPGLNLRAFLALAGRLRREGFQIVHTHNWSTMFYGVLAARWARVPIVLHGEHGINFEDLSGDGLKRRLAKRALARLCNRVVAVNQAMADSLARDWGIAPGKIETIPNGVDLARFSGARPGEGGTFTVGAVGRLDKIKNLPALLQAFALLRERHPGRALKLVLAGEGPMGAELLREHERLGLGEAVEFAGDCPAPEKVYARLSMFVNCSFFEGMSNTLLEAMSSGLPLAASDVDGNRSWLREGRDALFFDPRDPAALAAAMEHFLLRPEEAREMGARNRARAEREFDNNFFLEKYDAMYERLTKRRQAGPVPSPAGSAKTHVL